VRRGLYVLLLAAAACQSLSGLSDDGADGGDSALDGGAVDGAPAGGDGAVPDGAVNPVDALDAAVDVPVPNRVVFVSSLEYPPALGGLAGADAKCQSLAGIAGLSGTFRAWLAISDGGSPRTRMTISSGAYVLVNDIVVAKSFNGLLSPPELLAPIDVTENGTKLAPSGAWTNTDDQGLPLEYDCLGWTTSDNAFYGRSTQTSAQQLRAQQIYACNNMGHLFCVQQ
jgi:hypothetical protein